MGKLPTHDVLAIIGEKPDGGNRYANIGSAWVNMSENGEISVSVDLKSLPIGSQVRIFQKREPLEQGFQQPQQYQQPPQHYQQAPQLQPQQPQPTYSAPEAKQPQSVHQPNAPMPTYNQYSRSKG